MLETEKDFVELLYVLFESWRFWFPEWSILTEYKIWDNLRPDIVIALDEILWIIEVKKWKVDFIKAKEQIKAYYNAMEKKDIELFLVCFWPLDEPKKTKFYQYDKINDTLEEIKWLPNYEYFLNKRKKEIRKKLIESINWFNWIWWIIWTLLVIFWIYCIFSDISISNGQFFIILLWIAVTILPFLTRIKLSWLEFEFKNKK